MKILILMPPCGAHSWGPVFADAAGSVGVAVSVTVTVTVGVGGATEGEALDDGSFDGSDELDEESDPQPATATAARTRPATGAR
jgi:hypothetical protein